MAVLSGCGSSSNTPKASSSTTAASSGGSYKIGLSTELTGPLAAIGKFALTGVQAAFTAAGNKVNGHPIDLVTVDTQSTSAGSAQSAVQLAGDQVSAIITYDTSSNFSAEIPTLSSANIAVFDASTGPDAILTPTPASWFFDTLPSGPQQAANQINFAKNLLGGSIQGKRIAIDYIPQAYNPQYGYLKSLIASQGGQLVDSETAPLALASFASQAQAMAAAKPDIVLSWESTANEPVVTQALKVAGYNGPVLGTFGTSDDATFQKIASTNYYGYRFYQTVSESPVMSAATSQQGLGPDSYNSGGFTYGWATAQIIMNLLKKCGYPCSGSKMISVAGTLGNFSLPGVAYGTLHLDSKNHAALTVAQMYNWDASTGKPARDGNPVPIG